MRSVSRHVIAAALAACAFGGQAAAQLPSGGQVVAGQASITATSATSLLIHTTTQNTIINFSRFSIGAGSSVSILEPNASSILLSRVTGNVPSWLLGTLTANGRFWLVNPAGIYIGAGAHLTAAGLLFSTADIANQDFLAGNYNFGIASSNPKARIVNHGQLTASDGGAVVAAAPEVRNDGVIEADLGTVVLAGAKTYTVDFAGDNLLSFAITGAVDQVAPGTKALIGNDGTVAAPGGRVLLTADAAKGVLDNVINTSGIVTATSVASVNGKIVLSGTGGATVVSGTLDASGKGAGETGGTVKVLGDSVALASGARLDASGDAGGGTVLVGGNFHGAGPERNATATTVARGAAIAADAITSGTGGKVAVWSDGVTSFAGSITARGGANGGDGGYVETSGHTLAVASGAIVNTSAPHGKSGLWLLDPDDIEIVPGTGEDSNIGFAPDSGGDVSGSPNVLVPANSCGSATTVCSVLYADTIETALQGANGTNIAVTAPSGSITVDSGVNIVWTTASSLLLAASDGVVLNAGVHFDNTLSPINYASLQIAGSVVIGASTGAGDGRNGSNVTSFGQSNATGGGGNPSGGAAALSFGAPTGIAVLGTLGGSGALDLNASAGIVINATYYGTSATIEASASAGSVATVPSVPSAILAITRPNPPPLPPGDPVGPGGGPLQPAASGTAPPPPPPPLSNLAGEPLPFLGGGGPETPSTVLTNVAEIDQGAQIFSSIAPIGGGSLGAVSEASAGDSRGSGAAGAAPSGTAGAGSASAGGIGSGSAFGSADISAGGGQFADPLTIVAPIHAAPQPAPLPPAPDEPVGGRGSAIFQARPFVVPPQGVPGITGAALAGGNRALWFGRSAP